MGCSETSLARAKVQKQIFLPLALGGLGFRAARDVASLAFMASVAQHSSVLHPLPPGIIMNGLVEAYKFVRERDLKLPLIPANADQFVGFFAGQNEKSIGHLQRRFSAVLDKYNSSSLFSSLGDVDKARVFSVSNKPAGLWLSTLPTSHDFSLSDNHFQSAIRLRLGLKQHPLLPKVCVCGESLSDPGHFLGCQKLASRSVTRRHDAVVRVLARMGRVLAVDVRAEPKESRHVVDGRDRRPDIRSYGTHGAGALADVAIVHPCARAYIGGGSAERGSAAKTRERDKHRKFDECAKREGVPFYAFVLEGFGLVGEEALDFVDFLVQERGTAAPFVDPTTIRPYVLRNIAFALQRGNAAIVAEGIDLNLGRK